MSISEL